MCVNVNYFLIIKFDIPMKEEHDKGIKSFLIQGRIQDLWIWRAPKARSPEKSAEKNRWWPPIRGGVRTVRPPLNPRLIVRLNCCNAKCANSWILQFNKMYVYFEVHLKMSKCLHATERSQNACVDFYINAATLKAL